MTRWMVSAAAVVMQIGLLLPLATVDWSSGEGRALSLFEAAAFVNGMASLIIGVDALSTAARGAVMMAVTAQLGVVLTVCGGWCRHRAVVWLGAAGSVMTATVTGMAIQWVRNLPLWADIALCAPPFITIAASVAAAILLWFSIRKSPAAL